MDCCSRHLTGDEIINNYTFCAIYSVNITLTRAAASKTLKVMYSPALTISYSGEAKGEVWQPEDRGLYQSTQLLFSCSKSVSRTSPSRFQRRGWSLNAMEQNSFFDNDIKGDGCFCVWSGACLKCSEDCGVVGQVHCCFALGMIISCYRHESLKQLSAWHVNNDLPFLPADAKPTLTPKYLQYYLSSGIHFLSSFCLWLQFHTIRGNY